MKVSCLQENLSKGLSIVGRAVSPRSALPILSNVLLATDEGRLKLSANNMEIQIDCWIGARVEEEGAITVPAGTFADLVNALPPEQVDLELIPRTQTLNLRAGRSQANIKGLDAQDFPAMPLPEEQEGIPVEADALREALRQVTFSAATEETRRILTGVLAWFEEERLTLVATDGYRLSMRVVPLSQPVEEPFKVVVPARAMTELSRISGDQEDPIIVSLSPAHNQVVFRLTNSVLTSQLVDGNYPDYQRIIPKKYKTRTVVDTAAFLKACKMALIFARESSHVATLHIRPESELAAAHMVVAATSVETGDDSVELDATIEGDELDIAFNVRYLIDVLSVINTPQVALETSDATLPGVIRPVGDENYVHVLMPMHLG